MKLPKIATDAIKDNNVKLKALFINKKLVGWKAYQNGKHLGFYWL
jgi:hypothetical protein